MIPKVIHYCWFGGKPLPESAEKCIASWKKFCPDYEIKRWDETNFDVNCCDYVKEAYEANKWAFVSDYARFDILYREGGLYFDTDVELIKPIDDILEAGPFMGCEPTNNKNNVAPGLGLAANPGLGLAANPGLGLYKEILDGYKKRHFVKKDGSEDLYTVVYYVTEILKEYGFDTMVVDKVQNVCGINIYPTEYFCPLNCVTMKMLLTENTRSIHHYDASWVRFGKLRRLMKQCLPQGAIKFLRMIKEFIT